MAKKVLITGVAGGIGLETAKLFLAKGWEVIGTDIKEMTEALDINFIQGDISDEANSKIIFDSINGKLDALVNNAAIQLFKSLKELSIQDWNHVFRSNLYPVFFIAREAVELMKNNESSIINICSIHALATSMNMSSYASSKGALLSLTKSLAIELAPDGIGVNAIQAGVTDTPALRKIPGNDQMIDFATKHNPSGRLTTPDDIAEYICLLSQSNNSWLTGNVIRIDGGEDIIG